MICVYYPDRLEFFFFPQKHDACKLEVCVYSLALRVSGGLDAAIMSRSWRNTWCVFLFAFRFRWRHGSEGWRWNGCVSVKGAQLRHSRHHPLYLLPIFGVRAVCCVVVMRSMTRCVANASATTVAHLRGGFSRCLLIG